METNLWQLELEPLDHRHGGVLVEVMHHQHLERACARSLNDAAKGWHHVLAFVVDGNHHAEGRALGVAQILPASISSRTQGMTSSSISSREVVASKPRTSRALLTSGA